MSKKNGYFYFTCSFLTGEVLTFSKTPPSPLNLKRGSTAFPLNPLWLRRSPSRSAMIKFICHCSRLIRTFPSGYRGLKAWPAGPVRANKLSP